MSADNSRLNLGDVPEPSPKSLHLTPKLSSRLSQKSQISQLLTATRQNNKEEIEHLLSTQDFHSMSQKKVSECFKCALESNNPDLADSLKSYFNQVPAGLLLSAVFEKKIDLLRTMIGYQIYSLGCVTAYLWYLVHEGYEELATKLINTHEELQSYSGTERINPEGLLTNRKLAEKALQEAFEANFDPLAERILEKNPALAEPMYIGVALEKECLGFLRVASFLTNDEKAKNSTNYFTENIGSDNVAKPKAQSSLIIEVFQHYLEKKKFPLVSQVVLWPEAAKHPEILYVLILNNLEQAAQEHLKKFSKKSLAKDFFFAFEHGQLSLCITMIKIGTHNLNLKLADFQFKLVEKLNHPDKCFEALELLAMINKKEWITEVTKTLCTNVQNFAKKTDNILFCPKPILYCVKVAEFFMEVSDRSYEFRAKCEDISKLYKDLGGSLQDQLKNEEDLRYFMLQEDSEMNTTMYLIAKNRFYEMMMNEDLGTIVVKMWGGAKNARSLYEASTIYTSVISGVSNPDSQIFMKRMNKSRSYTFQYGQWVSSCSFRFFGQGLSAAFLVLIYQILIYRAFQIISLYDLGNASETRGYLRLVQAWIFGIFVEGLLNIIYVYKKSRIVLINVWKFLDIIMFVLMILISNNFSGGYIASEFTSDPTNDLPAGILLSLLMLAVWLRFASIVTLTKAYGQFLRIIYYMIGETLNFFVILIALFICAAGVFAATFYPSNPNFVGFDISLRTVFSDAMGNFAIDTYTAHMALGGAMEAFYLMISNVVMLNLLIAIITNVYEELVDLAESEHRNVVITYIEKYKWDEKYAFLLYLPSPFSSLVFIFCPFILLFSKEIEKWNDRICKVFFIVYCIGNFCIFNAIGVIYMIPLYFKGFVVYSTRIKRKEDNVGLSQTIHVDEADLLRPSKFTLLSRGTVWFFIGLPLIMWALVRDAYDFFTVMYATGSDSKEDVEMVKFDTFLDRKFMKRFHRVLENIQEDEIGVKELMQILRGYDLEGMKLEEQVSKVRTEEIEEFLRQFLMNNKEKKLNLEVVRRVLPRLEDDQYSPDYINYARSLKISSFAKGIRDFHANIGALNISGVTIPKLEVTSAFDMERVNNLNESIQELDDHYSKLLQYSSRLLRNIEEPPK